MWFLLYSAVAIIFLLVATYYDLKTRMIPKEISLGLVGIGLSLHFLESAVSGNVWLFLNSVISVIVAYAILYLVWLFGVLSGGDVKLLVGLNAMFPSFNRSFAFVSSYHLAFLPILWNGLLVIVVPLLFYLAFKQRASLIPLIKANFFKSLGYAFLIYSTFSFYHGITAWMLVFALSFVPMKWLILLPAGISSSLQFGWSGLLVTFVYLFAISLVFDILMSSKHLFRTEKSVNDLKPGDIISDVIVSGKFYPSSLVNIIKFRNEGIVPRSSGLTSEDIQLLKKWKVKSVRVQRAIPFTPIILLGFVTLVLIGDLVWLGVRLL